MNAREFSLAMAEEDVALRVVAIRGGPTFARRVAEIGLQVGCEIRVCQRQPAGLVVARGEARFALDGGMAHRIRVSPL